jgi:transcriptional regulator with XRE-family HTH domain
MQDTTSREAIASEVRAAMARRRATQQDLANALGITRSTVASRLACVTAFDTDELLVIARTLGVPFLSLFPDEVA